jgi:hypothetical protein
LKNKDSRTSNGVRIGSNPKSKPLRSGIKGKNIRRRRKWKPYDGRDKPLINDIFSQLVNKNIRVETRDGESKTVSKYEHQAEEIIYSNVTYSIKNPFVISVSDLSPDLITRLLDSRRKDYILYRVVERFIELHDDRGFLAPYEKRRYPWLFHP